MKGTRQAQQEPRGMERWGTQRHQQSTPRRYREWWDHGKHGNKKQNMKSRQRSPLHRAWASHWCRHLHGCLADRWHLSLPPPFKGPGTYEALTSPKQNKPWKLPGQEENDIEKSFQILQSWTNTGPPPFYVPGPPPLHSQVQPVTTACYCNYLEVAFF